MKETRSGTCGNETAERVRSDTRKDVIAIEGPIVSDRHRITFRLRPQGSIGRFFMQNYFWAEYDTEIQDVPASILAIPCISAVIWVAWAFDADIEIAQADEAFVKSLEIISDTLTRSFPYVSFNTRIHGERVANTFHSRNTGLLFSGGVDSVASYFRQRHLHPILINIVGANIPLKEQTLWKAMQKVGKDYAALGKLGFRTVASNLRSFLDETCLTCELKELHGGHDWWTLQHGISVLGLCAPICSREGISELFIASTYTEDFGILWGSHPLIDNNVRMGSTTVVHDAYEFTRQDKIRSIFRKEMTRQASAPPLIVCDVLPRSTLNCSSCDKCSRAIVGLILEGIDPRGLGFTVNQETLGLVRMRLEKGTHALQDHQLWLWKDIQCHIPSKLDHDLFGASEFFSWLRSFDVENSRGARKAKRKGARAMMLRVFCRIPKVYRALLISLYRRTRTKTLHRI